MNIDISSIVRKHLSTSNTVVEEAVDVSTEGVVAVEESTESAEGVVAVEESTECEVLEPATAEEIEASSATVEESVKEETGGLKVDFSSIAVAESTSSTNTVVDAPVEHDWFMTEDERTTVEGALIASVVTNAVNV